MRSKFSPFYKIPEESLETIWRDAVFIFNSNVLLKLYSYKKASIYQFFSVLDKISERIWLPYYAALEFQKQRIDVIAKQSAQFAEARQIVQSGVNGIVHNIKELRGAKKHVLFEPNEFIDNIESVARDYILELTVMEKYYTDITGDDEVRNRIDRIFNGRIGERKKNQDILNAIYEEGQYRYEKSIPPGYTNLGTFKLEDNIFYHDGLHYNRAYGDYLVWKEIIDYCKYNNIERVIFVNDNEKKDWWLGVYNNGENRISAREELISEIQYEAKVKTFIMYNFNQFVQNAQKHLYLKDDATFFAIPN